MGKRAAEALDDDTYEEGPDPNDVLSRGWKAGLYGAALIPYGAWFVVLGSSILFYAWRKEFPNRAKSVNRHGWLAWLLGLALWGGIWFLQRGDAPSVEAALPPSIVAPRPRLSMDNIYRKVATDAEERYQIARRQGDPIQVCVQAGMVSAAWLQAKDEAQYGAWKTQQKTDCAKAGMPQQP